MIAGPLIVSPFVVGEGDNSTSTVTPDQRREWLTYPFGIASLVQLVGKYLLVCRDANQNCQHTFDFFQFL